MRNKLYKILAASLALALAFTLSCSDDKDEGGDGSSFSYEGKTYKIVKINNQTWMAENLNYSVDGSRCYDSKSCEIYGRLYNWATAMALDSNCNRSLCASQISAKRKGICPPGWHIPSNAEWNTLVSNVERSQGCTNCAGKHLKATSGWDDCSASGPSTGSMGSKSCLDSYGFSALPGGGINKSSGNFSGHTAGDFGNWWIAGERSTSNASLRYAHNSYEYFSEGAGDHISKLNLFSVRCLKD